MLAMVVMGKEGAEFLRKVLTKGTFVIAQAGWPLRTRSSMLQETQQRIGRGVGCKGHVHRGLGRMFTIGDGKDVHDCIRGRMIV